MSAVYVYGLVNVETDLPADLKGVGPSGRVRKIAHGQVAAIVSEIPGDRPLGTRDDLIAHEMVLDAVAASAAVIPLRFPAVMEEEGYVVGELLAAHQDDFLAVLADLEERVQFTLKGGYEQDAVLREVLEGDPKIRALLEDVRVVPEDASYRERVQLGEMVVRALEEMRSEDAALILARLEPKAVATVTSPPSRPEEVVNAAFLVDRERVQEFEAAVEEVGREYDGRVRLKLLGPLAPYDFVGS